MQQGKQVFADNCAACHSSKAPAPPAEANLGACIGPHYLECWNRYWSWTQTDDYRTKMRQIVEADDFLDDNFLSNDARVPVTLLQTNACSPLATNAIAGNIWDNFSSASYKSLPSVGTITVYDPFTGKPQPYTMPAGGRGYTRVPSLVSVWATAPYLLNNSVGKFEASPSVAARMTSFEDSIAQMLWPDKRDKDAVFGDKIPGVIDRTTVTSWLRIPTGYLPDAIKRSQSVLNLAVPVFDEKGIEIGPIPAGTPVDLLANFDPLPPESSNARRAPHPRQTGRRGGVQAGARSARAAQERHRRPGPPGLLQCRRAVVRAQQMPGLRRQSRALFRRQAQRRRQERVDRLFEDVLA